MIHLLHLQGVSILEQLQLEEALLRCDPNNWCLINHGAAPAIVMGISGKAEQLVNLPLLAKAPIPLIRRFSGGGTVVIDTDTVFVTFICNADAIDVPLFPKKIMQWTETLYRPVFRRRGDFALRNNDYVFGDKKFGGNAQYICKRRWLHHSTLLWDYDLDRLQYLPLPPKMPAYRQRRQHADFLCRLRDDFPSQEHLAGAIFHELTKRFPIALVDEQHVADVVALPHRKTTEELTEKSGCRKP